MKPFIVKSFCKVNLGLKIINRTNDDYHNINSIFIEISLHDIIEIYQSSHLKIQFSNLEISNSNTVNKAVKIFSKYCDIDVKKKILINKNIPIGAGLGGGSSNAAYTLLALNEIYNTEITNQALEKLGLKIGSDVPFFIRGGIKEVSGTGNKIKDINFSSINDKVFLLVMPNFSISTKWAYGKIKKELYADKNNTKFSPLDDRVDWTLFENVFEHIVCLAYPEILDIKNTLYNKGSLYSGLSGSGSTMFGIYNDIIKAEKAVKNFKKYHTHIASPLI